MLLGRPARGDCPQGRAGQLSGAPCGGRGGISLPFCLCVCCWLTTAPPRSPGRNTERGYSGSELFLFFVPWISCFFFSKWLRTDKVEFARFLLVQLSSSSWKAFYFLLLFKPLEQQSDKCLTQLCWGLALCSALLSTPVPGPTLGSGGQRPGQAQARAPDSLFHFVSTVENICFPGGDPTFESQPLEKTGHESWFWL